MRSLIVGLAFCATACSVYATNSITLPPLLGSSSVIIETTKSYTGSCGKAVVRVLGVKKSAGPDFRSTLTEELFSGQAMQKI